MGGMRTLAKWVGCLVVVALLASAAVVMWGRDPSPPNLPPMEGREAPTKVHLGYAGKGGLFSDDYVDGIGVAVNGKPLYHLIVVRGALDRSAGTFPLSLEYAVPGTGDLKSVRVDATSALSWDLDADVWQPLGEATVVESGGWTVGRLLQAPTAPSASAYRVTETRKDGKTWSVGRSVPVAPTFFGRVYDRIGSWVPFRWLPDLR